MIRAEINLETHSLSYEVNGKGSTVLAEIAAFAYAMVKECGFKSEDISSAVDMALMEFKKGEEETDNE